MNKLEKISIVGGGTAGIVSALILKTRFPNKKINIIRSEKIGIIGVGEGSTEHWHEFMKYIGVSWRDVIKNCDATFKSGIMFKGWHDKDYLHSIGPEHEILNGQYRQYYAKTVAYDRPNKDLNPISVWDNRVDSWHLQDNNESPYNQYHFNTHKLNEYLTFLCQSKGIDIIDDEINDVVLNDKGEIDYLIGTTTNHKADFYIDSTGFKRILMSKLGAKWNSYSKYLKMKSAIVFPLPAKEEYNLWTTAQAMDNGWMFNIPVWGRSGNGYIFDSDYINADRAKDEVEKFLGHSIDVGKHLTFDPGALDNVWIKNCCAIGLSASFVEPLEATSIGTSINQSFLLMHKLPNYTEKSIKDYNNLIEKILLNIRDFVVLHYVTNKENTKFWKDVKNADLPETLQEQLTHWKHHLPIFEDFIETGSYALFKDPHYIQVLAGLKLFDQESILREYNMQSPLCHKIADDVESERLVMIKTKQTLGHKEFLSYLRGEK